MCSSDLGYETNGGVKNIFVRKYDETLDEIWTRTLPSATNKVARTIIVNSANNNVLAALRIGNQPNSSAGFIVLPQFSAAASGLLAMPGNLAGSVNLAWISEDYLPTGTTYYIQYSTADAGDINWDYAIAQSSGITDTDIPPGSKVDLSVAQLEAGLNAQNTPGNLDYYFKVWMASVAANIIKQLKLVILNRILFICFNLFIFHLLRQVIFKLPYFVFQFAFFAG